MSWLMCISEEAEPSFALDAAMSLVSGSFEAVLATAHYSNDFDRYIGHRRLIKI